MESDVLKRSLARTRLMAASVVLDFFCDEKKARGTRDDGAAAAAAARSRSACESSGVELVWSLLALWMMDGRW